MSYQAEKQVVRDYYAHSIDIGGRYAGRRGAICCVRLPLARVSSVW